MSSNTTHDKPRMTTVTKYLGRFEKVVAPIQLNLVQPIRRINNDDNEEESYRGRNVSIQHLEDSLKGCLNYTTNNDKDMDDDNGPDGPVVQYPLQADASWLHCRRSKTTNATLLGLQEGQVQQKHNVCSTSILVEICTFVARPDGTDRVLGDGNNNGDNDSKSCCLPGPCADWRREDLVVEENHPQFQQQQEPLQSEPEEPSCQLVHWVNLLPLTKKNNDEHKNWLPTLASTVHFLRSLLDTDDFSSPWRRRNTTSSSNSSARPDCVLLLVHQLPERFHEVRVGDVCPSWYVHTICRVRVPVDAETAGAADPWTPFFQREKLETRSAARTTTVATLVVYRRLDPRDHFSVLHPVHGQPATTGCLWESCTPTTVPEQQEQDLQLQPHMHVRMVAPPYISCRDEYPALVEPLLQPANFNILRHEGKAIQHWTAWPESQHYRARSSNSDSTENPTAGAPWKVFPLCHCFPASDVSHRQWIPMTCALVPQTVALLKSVLGDVLRTALFSRLDPENVLEAHTGWEDLANHVVRLHIPLQVPAAGDLCGTWVDGCVETHAEGRPVCFDDSKTHRAFNYSDQDRIVLILDLARPSALPLGTATGGHSEELDKFIEQMGLGGN
jgi:hypothetical protein